jgi:hypothetical protein
VRTHLLRLTAVAAQLAAVMVAAVLVPGSASASPAARQVFLITGERLLAGNVVISPGHRAGALLSLHANGTYAVPAAAVPYLGHGLAPDLFDVAALRHAEATGRLPVRVSYRGRPPALPGVRITRAAAGTAEGYLTASSAAVFGAALARQYLADRPGASFGADGLLRGVSIALATARAWAPGPAARTGFPMHTLTVTGTNRAGKPDTGDYVFVWNVDNGLRSDLEQAFGFFYHGVAKFSVPAGHYWAVGVFGHPAIFGTSPARLVVLPQFTVGANTTVHVAERTASSKVTMVTPRPAVARSGSLYLIRALAKGPQAVLQFSNSHSAMWVSPTSQRPTVGWLRADVSQELASPPGATRPRGAPYAYALSYAGPIGIIPPQRYLVRPASLTTIRETYYQEVKSPGYWAVFGSFPRTFNGYVEPYAYPGGLPGRRTIYVGGSPGADWGSYYGGLGAARGYGQEEFFRAARPGILTDNWNRYPLHPAVNVVLAPANELDAFLPSADRAGNMLTLDVTPFGDNQPGHISDGFLRVPGAKITGSYRIDENGRRIAAGNAVTQSGGGPSFYTRVRLSPKPSVISFALDATRTGAPYRLSTATRTVWTWRSAHESGTTLRPPWYCYNPSSPTAPDPEHCAVEPMMTLRYQVAGESLNGSAPAGRQVLTVTAGHLQQAKAARITGASVRVSFDGGKTWRPASVTALGAGRFRAVFTAPPGAPVTLRTTARDAAGGSVTETITDGYAT